MAHAAVTPDVVRFLRELFSLVRSDLSDFEATEVLGSVIEATPADVPAALEWLKQVGNVASPNYETDRARRVLAAAVDGTPPEPASSKDAQLFERERDLARMPQEHAFAMLLSAVPELSVLLSRAERLAGAPASFGINIGSGRVTIPSGRLPGTAQLVGPCSHHPDPLVRSPIAASVVSNYVVALITHTTHLALWDPGAPMRRGSLTGTLYA